MGTDPHGEEIVMMPSLRLALLAVAGSLAYLGLAVLGAGGLERIAVA